MGEFKNRSISFKTRGSKVDKDGIIRPTVAGLLMFGEEYNIYDYYPEYFLDFQETLDPTIGWVDRLQSTSGDWTGNLFDFFFRVSNKMAKNVKIPFRLNGYARVDDTPVHKALREVLVNCLVNSDFNIRKGVVIRLDEDKIVLENPGSIRVGKYQMRIGGESDPRNKTIMKMFNLIGMGERAGSGVPRIFSVWEDEGFEEPIIEEYFSPDRTIVTLPFEKVAEKSGEKKWRKKSGEKKVAKKISSKTKANLDKILSFMEDDTWYKTNDFLDLLNLKESRVKILLSELIKMDLIEDDGSTKGKRYRKNRQHQNIIK